MKFSFKQILITLPLLAMSLTSCANVSKTVKVALNLDLLTLNEDEKAFPRDLTGDELVTMIESKQDFVLFFHQTNCEMCKLVIPYFDQLLNPKYDKKQGYLPLNLFAFSANSSDFQYISTLYPNLLDMTPKTMLFKAGQNILTFATSRYKSYKVFESAINEFILPSKIMTGQKDSSIKNFITSMDTKPYLVYLRNTSKNTFGEYPTFSYWSKNVYPIVKDSETPTLLLTYDKLEDDAKKTVNETYGLTNQDVAIYVEGTNYTKYEYLNNQDSQNLMNLLNEKF